MRARPSFHDGGPPNSTDPEARLRGLVGQIAVELNLPPSHGGARAEMIRREIERTMDEIRKVGLGGHANTTAPPSPDGFRRLRLLADSWPRVDALLGAQLQPCRRSLFPQSQERPDEQDMGAAQTRMADAAAGVFHHLLSRDPQSPEAEAAGCFSDLSLSQSLFLTNLQAACRVLLAQGRSQHTGFLDVGCGSGLKLLTAAPWFDRVTGLELDPGYAETARRLLKMAPVGNTHLLETDARQFDGYGDFDVIYFFRPMRYADALADLENRIAATARTGCLLIAPYEQFGHRAASLGCARIGGHLYLAGGDGSQAEALAREAEFFGPAIAGVSEPLPPLWTPIIEASWRRGFAP